LIDEYSRWAIAWKSIPDHTALSIADLLANVLAKFEDVLQRFGIHHITSDSYTRQQNGTIERFWSTADKASSVKELPGVFESDN
jgi:transposase InsO family protein